MYSCDISLGFRVECSIDELASVELNAPSKTSQALCRYTFEEVFTMGLDLFGIKLEMEQFRSASFPGKDYSRRDKK